MFESMFEFVCSFSIQFSFRFRFGLSPFFPSSVQFKFGVSIFCFVWSHLFFKKKKEKFDVFLFVYSGSLSCSFKFLWFMVCEL